MKVSAGCRRPEYQYEMECIEGAVNVPMFRKVAGSSPWDRIKRIAMGALAMTATGEQLVFLKEGHKQFHIYLPAAIENVLRPRVRSGLNNLPAQQSTKPFPSPQELMLRAM